MLLSAMMAIRLKNLVSATISVGVMSLFASILYLLMSAPDVAMTEAAIGAGLGTVIFLYAIAKTQSTEVDDD
jgi:uncharacterized MnhB-related membrane protein